LNGFIPLNKPVGISSQQAVSRVKKILGCKKAGHTGTLDPAASGLLLIALGKATRLSEYFLNGDKGYRAEIAFGQATDTGDREGRLIDGVEDFYLPAAEVEAALQGFLGRIRQRPPQASALKIDGQRAYTLFRRGLNPEMPLREVFIHSLKIVGESMDISPANPVLTLDIVCSKGTYIRSLAVDIGRALGLPAHLSGLVRTQLSQVSLTQAASFADLERDYRPFLLDMSVAVASLPRLDLGQRDAARFLHGRPIPNSSLRGEVAVFSDARLLGIARVESGLIKPTKVLAQE
jgi:tRNA pseudouridine55 synthase